MKIERRPHGIILIAESESESAMLDETFGKDVGEDGLIGVRQAECRLSDGYGEHYVFIKNKKIEPVQPWYAPPRTKKTEPVQP